MAVGFNADADSVIGSPPPTSRYTLAGWMFIATDTNTFATLAEICIGIGTKFHEFQTLTDGTTMCFNDHTAAQIVTDPTTQAVGEWWFNATVTTGSSTAIYQMKEGGTSLVKTSSATLSESFTPDQYMLGSDIFAEFLNGSLRGVKLWNAALSDAELLAESKQFAPVRTAGLWSYYKLKDTATMLLDTSGNGRNLTNPSGTGTWTTTADPNVPETLPSSTARAVYTNGSTDPQAYIEPLDPNADRIAVNAIYPQGVAPTAVNATAAIFVGPSGMRLTDVTRTSDLINVGGTGPTGPAGVTGSTGRGSRLQDLYDSGPKPGPSEMIFTPTLGGLYVGEPSGGVSGGILFRVMNSVTAGATAYFQVSPTGIQSAGQISGKRLDLNGTLLQMQDFSLGRIGSGNGQTNSQYGVTNISGDDSHGRFTVVCGQTGYTLNPLVILNFKDGPRANTPFVIAKLTAPMSPTAAVSTGGPTGMGYESQLVEVSLSPTSIAWQINCAPTARAIFTISYIALA